MTRVGGSDCGGNGIQEVVPAAWDDRGWVWDRQMCDPSRLRYKPSTEISLPPFIRLAIHEESVGGSYSKCSTHHAYLTTVVNFLSHLIVHLSDFQVHWAYLAASERRMWEEVCNLQGISTDSLYILVNVLESGVPTIYVWGYGPMVGVLPWFNGRVWDPRLCATTIPDYRRLSI